MNEYETLERSIERIDEEAEQDSNSELNLLFAELKKVKSLLKDAYDHLNYCGWGDSWERECSEQLRRELDTYFN